MHEYIHVVGYKFVKHIRSQSENLNYVTTPIVLSSKTMQPGAMQQQCKFIIIMVIIYN